MEYRIVKLFGLTQYFFDVFRRSALLRNIAKVYGGNMLSKIFAIGVLLLLIRGLSIGDYAFYTAFCSMRLLIPGLLCNGINMGLVRFSAEYLSKGNKRPSELYFLVFSLEILLFMLFCLVLLFFAGKVSSIIFGNMEFIKPFRYGLLAGGGVLLTNAGRSVYQAEERFNLYIISMWIRQVLVFLFIVYLFLFGKLNFSRAALTIIIVDFIVGFAIAHNIFRDFKLRKAFIFVRKEFDLIKEFLSATKWLVAYFCMLAAFGRLGVFMLSHFSTKDELANYGVAYGYYSMALLLLGSIHAVLHPKFSKMEMQDAKRQRTFALIWLRNTVWLVIPLIIIDLSGKRLFSWLNGEQYEDAFYIFVVFSFGIWLSLMLSPLMNILRSRKKFRFMFLLSAITFVVSFAGNYMLIPIWGGFGAALSTVLSQNIVLHGLSLAVILKR